MQGTIADAHTPAIFLLRLTWGLAVLLAIYTVVRRIYQSGAARVMASFCFCCCPPCTAVFILLVKGWGESESRHNIWICVAVMGYFFGGNVCLMVANQVSYEKVCQPCRPLRQDNGGGGGQHDLNDPAWP